MFRSKKEIVKPNNKLGKFGTFIIGSIVLVIGFKFFDIILPFMIGVMTNLIHLTILLGIFGTLIFCFQSKTVRSILKDLKRNLKITIKYGLRRFFEFILKIDPLKMTISIYEDKLQEGQNIIHNIGELEGNKIAIQDKIVDNNNNILILLNEINSAKEQSKLAIVKAKSQELAKLHAANNILHPILETTNISLEGLYDVRDAASNKLDEMKTQIISMKLKHDIIEPSSRAIESASKILSTSGFDNDNMFGNSVDEFERQNYRKLGRMKAILDNSKQQLQISQFSIAEGSKNSLVIAEQYQNGELKIKQPFTLDATLQLDGIKE